MSLDLTGCPKRRTVSDSRTSKHYYGKCCDGSLLVHLVSICLCNSSYDTHDYLWFLGLPHRLRQDDTHAGYFFPKDTIVLANIWYVQPTRTKAVIERTQADASGPSALLMS